MRDEWLFKNKIAKKKHELHNFLQINFRILLFCTRISILIIHTDVVHHPRIKIKINQKQTHDQK